MKSSAQYQMLRKRVFAAFMYGAMLNFAGGEKNRLNDIYMGNKFIEKRQKDETRWEKEMEKCKLEGEMSGFMEYELEILFSRLF